MTGAASPLPREVECRLIAGHTYDVVWVFDVADRRLIYISPSVEKLPAPPPA